jgi:hypothetical protein
MDVRLPFLAHKPMRAFEGCSRGTNQSHPMPSCRGGGENDRTSLDEHHAASKRHTHDKPKLV